MTSSDEGQWKNDSGLATVIAADVAILGLCLRAHDNSANKQRWSPDDQVAAANAIKGGPSTRLALALRANTWLKSQFAEVTKQSSNVGDKACFNMTVIVD